MKPLSGLRILDFSTLLPGPWASQQLMAMGAEVTRIESPKRPDLLHQFPAVFAQVNGGKTTWALDLNQPEDLQQILDSLGEFDILLEQFRPGVMAKFGLSYEQLKDRFPKLIYCSLTGFGQTGPLAHKAGHDIYFLALSCSASYSGRLQPELSGVQIADLAGGSQAAIIAILAAVLQRQQTGQGQHLDVAMADHALTLNVMAAPQVLAGGDNPGLATEWLNGGLFYGYYQCADQGWLAVGGLEPKFVQTLCDYLNKPEWVPRFFHQGPESQEALRADLAALFKQRNRDDWQPLFDLDCCVEPVLTLKEALNHPHFIARGMVTEVNGEKRLGAATKFLDAIP